MAEEIRIVTSAAAGEVAGTAAEDLTEGLRAMLGGGVAAALPGGDSPATRIVVAVRGAQAPQASEPLAGDSFAIAVAPGAIAIDAGSERGLIHAGARLLERLGARYAPGLPPEYPRIDSSRLFALAGCRVEPSFTRRAFVSDIMTWNYGFEDRLALHLRHDQEFIPWMARHGVNAFSYIRHAHDTSARIDQLVTRFRERGIDAEYGGHVIQLLLPRERFETNPELFPLGADGKPMARGNLCGSNPAGLALVRKGALEYIGDCPENRLLHVWGADVFDGAWCRCEPCSRLTPQLQYLKVVNAIAESLPADGPPVAYLAYHDTIDPDPALKPRANVWFEWAPRERCYSHAIDDPACETNPRYWRSLGRYVELFEGRGHIFEYYADAILFGGLGFATPQVIARDLRAYHGLGLRSISCLTFGQYSTLAYPVNLDAFVRAATSIDFDPDATVADLAAVRHPSCGAEMASAYRAIQRAAQLVLTYGDVMRPPAKPEFAARKRPQLRQAIDAFRSAIDAAGRILAGTQAPLVAAERSLWEYSLESLQGVEEFLAAMQETGPGHRVLVESAISRVGRAVEHIHAIELETKGTWGAYDIDWIRHYWLDAMRRALEGTPARDPF